MEYTKLKKEELENNIRKLLKEMDESLMDFTIFLLMSNAVTLRVIEKNNERLELSTIEVLTAHGLYKILGELDLLKDKTQENSDE